jgi:hypothetical protein
MNKFSRSTNCQKCKFFDCGLCPVNPLHATVWAETKYLDDYVKEQIEVNGHKLNQCNWFEPLRISYSENFKRLRKKALIKGSFFGFLFIAFYCLLDNPELIATFLPVNLEHISPDIDMSEKSYLLQIGRIIVISLIQTGMTVIMVGTFNNCCRYSQIKNILNSFDKEIYSDYYHFALAFTVYIGFLPVAVNEIFSIALSF